jgi:hypothetical protein
LDPCLLRISGIVLLGESRYETNRESHLISMANCRRVDRKVNRRGSRIVKGPLERM